jgi:hypothetical protein
MHFRITGDTDIKSGIGPIIDRVSGPTRKHFQSNEYGTELGGIVVVLMCQDPKLNLKKRVKLDKNKKILYIDIMLNLPEMESATPQAREKVVYDQIVTEVPELVRKYKFKDFDESKFSKDLKLWFASPI